MKCSKKYFLTKIEAEVAPRDAAILTEEDHRIILPTTTTTTTAIIIKIETIIIVGSFATIMPTTTDVTTTIIFQTIIATTPTTGIPIIIITETIDNFELTMKTTVQFMEVTSGDNAFSIPMAIITALAIHLAMIFKLILVAAEKAMQPTHNSPAVLPLCNRIPKAINIIFKQF